MPSDTLFVCLLCSNRIDPRPAVHLCQKECVREAGVHVDICDRCKTVNLALFETEMYSESENRPE